MCFHWFGGLFTPIWVADIYNQSIVPRLYRGDEWWRLYDTFWEHGGYPMLRDHRMILPPHTSRWIGLHRCCAHNLWIGLCGYLCLIFNRHDVISSHLLVVILYSFDQLPPLRIWMVHLTLDFGDAVVHMFLSRCSYDLLKEWSYFSWRMPIDLISISFHVFAIRTSFVHDSLANETTIIVNVPFISSSQSP